MHVPARSSHPAGRRSRLRPWLLVPAACLLLTLAPARGDLIIFRDGFYVHGQLKQDKVVWRDPVGGKVFVTAKLDGFYQVDDGARRIIFSAARVADATKGDFERAVETVKLERISRLNGGAIMDPFWQVESVGSFGKSYERLVTLRTSNNRIEVRQRVNELSPRYLRLDALFYRWTAYHLTREFDPDTMRTLLYQLLDRKTAKVKLTEAEKRFQVFRFLLQANWYDAAEKELNNLQEALPEQKKRSDAARETLRKLRALDLADRIERAHRAGQHREARELIAQFDKDRIDADAVGERRYGTVQSLKEKYRRLTGDLEVARTFLKSLPGRVQDGQQQEVFKEAAAVMLADLNLDTVQRIDGFIGLATQAERDIKRKKKPAQTPQELLALAVSGWLMGNDASETRVDTALQLWAARNFVLTYQKTSDLVDRRKMVKSASTTPQLGLDEVAQLIRFLPPPEPEAKITTKPVELKTGGRGRGQTYRVQLPPEYHPNRPYPVLFVLHGSRESAKEMLGHWSDLAAQHGYILVAPEWGRGLEAAYTYTAAEHAAVVDVLRDLRRRFQVDSDRVFLFGHEEGGNMAYDVGLAHPDLFAGVIPMTGRPKFFAFQYWTNAQYLSFYVVDGGMNGKNPKSNRDQFKEWVRSQYPCLYVEYKGRGPEWFEGELPSLFDWMAVQRRAHPRRSLGSDGNGGVFGQEFRTMRDEDNHFYWLSTGAIRPGCLNDAANWNGLRRPASLTASVGTGNHIYVGAHGVGDVTVWFPPALIDFGKPVTIRINGSVVMNKKDIQPSWETLLEDFYRRGDRHQLFLAKKTFTFR
jgi:hypothetical protein